MQWVETFCDLATVYDSNRKLKKRTNKNMEMICRDSLTLLDFALYRFNCIDKVKQEELVKKVTDTFAKTLQCMPDKLSDLPGQNFQRIMAHIPDMVQYIKDLGHKNMVLDGFAKAIPAALKTIMERPTIETAQIMLRLCEGTPDTPSEIYKICSLFNPDKRCQFLCAIIESTIALQKYQEILQGNPEDASIIAKCIGMLMSECGVACDENEVQLCNGMARKFLRYWLSQQAPQLISSHKKVISTLSGALVTMEQRTNKQRAWRNFDRLWFNHQGNINNNNTAITGMIKNISPKGALFECNNGSVNKVKEALSQGGNQFEIIANQRITKSIHKIEVYKPLKDPSSADAEEPNHIFGVFFSDPLSTPQFEECKKHVNGTLVYY